jgi:hypothetical protein
VTNNDISVHDSKLCATYKAGKKNARSRDIHTAECIALKGASQFLMPYTSPPFDQKSQSNTVHPFPMRSFGSGKEEWFLTCHYKNPLMKFFHQI